MDAKRASALGLTVTVGAIAFVALAHASARRKTSRRDAAARRKFPKRRRRGTKQAAVVFGKLGDERVHAPVAAAAAAALMATGRRSAGGAIAMASVGSALLSRAMEVALPHRAPPPGKHKPSDNTFPSGHTFELASLCLVTAYVLSRENLGPAAALAPAAVAVPVLGALDRLYLDSHWLNDVFGGAAAATAYAGLVAIAYETLRTR